MYISSNVFAGAVIKTATQSSTEERNFLMLPVSALLSIYLQPVTSSSVPCPSELT